MRPSWILKALSLLFLLLLPASGVPAEPPSSADVRSPLEAALAAAREAGDRRTEARALKDLGNLAANSGKQAEAATLYRQALDIARAVDDTDLAARLLNNLGLLVRSTEGEDKARKLFEDSLKIAAKDRNETVEALALANLADLDLAADKARAALPRLERAAGIVRRLGPPPVAARVLATLARAYEELGDRKEALKLYTEALPPAQASGNRTGESGILLGLGMALLKDGQAGAAVAPCREALTLAREIGDGETEAAALQGLALAYEQLGDSTGEAEAARDLRRVAGKLGSDTFAPAAERHLQVAEERERAENDIDRRRKELDAAQRRGERAVVARLSLDLGLVLMGQNKIPESVAAIDRSLVLSGETHDRLSQTLALNALVRLWNANLLGEAPESLDPVLHMVQAVKDLQLRELECQLLLELGRIHLARHDPRQAFTPLEKGLALAGELSLREPTLIALERLAFVHELLGDETAVLRSTEKLLAEATKAGDHLRIGAALKGLAAHDLNHGDPVGAIERLNESLAAFARATSGTDLLRPHVFQSLGIAHFQVGDYRGAFNNFKSSAEESQKAGDRKGEALALQLQAGAALALGERAAAEKLLMEALVLGRSLSDRTLEIHAHTSLALVAWDSDPRRAIEPLGKALDLIRKPGPSWEAGVNRQEEAITLGLLARAHANLDETARALELANSGLTAASEGNGFDRALALDHRAYVHFRAGRLPQAEADARAAADLFAIEEARLGQHEMAKVGARDQKSTLNDLLQQVVVRAGKPEEALAIAERGRAQTFLEALGATPAKPSSPDALARIARDLRATVVEYSVLYDPTQFLLSSRSVGLQPDREDELYIWVVRPDGNLTFRSVNLRALGDPGGEPLQNRVRFLLQLVSGPQGDKELPGLLSDLHHLLIAPIADLLPADPDAPVVIVPHGPLFRVPFAALLDPSGRYLIQRHTLLTAPSMTSLASLRRPWPVERPKGAGTLVVGNPRTALEAGTLTALPNAEREARAVADELKAEALVGRQATEAAVIQALPRARLVHLATHGLLKEEDDEILPGALALAPSAAGEDGLLTSGEIRALRLSADLVVLSACDSGRGRITRDGVIGLARSFLAAGAAGVVMSQWQIDDEATSTIMIDFYRQLRQSRHPAQALRAAMLAAVKRGERERFWGAFTYVGAP